MSVPEWQLYYRAAALVWIKDWILEEDQRLLKPEGSDLLLGWHAFVWYDKIKTHKYFLNHCLRKALYYVWSKVRDSTYVKIPDWVSPLEEFMHPALRTEKKNHL